MKVYVDRAAVLKILSSSANLQEAKKLVEDLPTTAVTEDNKMVFRSYGSNHKIVENAGTIHRANSRDAKKPVDDSLTMTVIEDNEHEMVFRSYGSNQTFIANVGTMNISFE